MPSRPAVRERYSFANLDEIEPLPDLISIQRSSFEWFLNNGLAETFRDISPIEDFSGTLRLDSSVSSKVKTPAVVFLIAREAGKTSGPPVAVRRMEVASFPVAFTLTGANAMMAGTPLPAKVRVEARIDSDGDVTTKTGDPVGSLDGLAVNSKDASIVIK